MGCRRRSARAIALQWPGSGTPSRPLARALGQWPSAPSGCGARRAQARKLDGIDRAAARTLVDSALADAADAWLTPADTRALLLAYGLPLVAEQVVAGADEAVAAAREIGFPVVVKTAEAGAHKTEVGGIALNLGDEAAVRAAVERIGRRRSPSSRWSREAPKAPRRRRPGSRVRPARRLRAGRRLRRADRRGRVPHRAADRRGRRRARHGRESGAPRRRLPRCAADDVDALVDLVLRLARLGDDLPEVAELDLNPVLALPEGCVVVDARPRAATRAARSREDLVDRGRARGAGRGDRDRPAHGARRASFVFARHPGRSWLAVANALAAGCMVGASLGLVWEGRDYGTGRVAAGAVAGAIVLALTRVVLRHRPMHLEGIGSVDAARMLMIVGVMTVHSFTEGIGVGIDRFGGGGALRSLHRRGDRRAQHPGKSSLSSLVLIPRGVSVSRAAAWSVFSSLC